MTVLQMTFPGMAGGPQVRAIAWRDLIRSFYARLEPRGLWPRAGETALSVSGSRADEPGLARPIVWAKRAVLLVDVVESVRLVEQDEAGAIARWLAFVEHVKTRVLPEWKGRAVKSLGDGLLLDFDDARSAAAAAFAIQHASNRENEGRAESSRMHLRMGLEVSDVVIEPDDLHGRGVNLAARLMSLAGPGEIVVSAHVHDQLTPDLDAESEDLGDCFLRHVSQPVRAYRIGPPGPRPLTRPAAPHDELAPFVAVLPFAPRLTAPEHEVIGEILAEEVIRSLSVTADLNVISRLSTSLFRGRQLSLDEIRTHLNADYVLSGVFSSDGNGLTLNAELAEARSGRILWTDRAKARVSDVVSGDPQLTARIAAEVNSAIVAGELRHAQTQSLPTLKSYSLLLGAIALMHRLSIDDFHYARELLQTLLERGSRHPIALAWLANWHVLRVQQGWSADEKAEALRALDCTKRALDADPNCSLALAVDGFVHTNLVKRLDVAEERYNAALASNPNNAFAWLLRGTLFTFKEDGARAINDTQHALSLAPLGPHRWFYDALAAGACLTARDYDRAFALSLRSKKANRKHPSTLRILTVAQWQLGLHEDARRTARELLAIQPDLTVGRWRARSPGGSTATGSEIAKVLRLVGVPE